MQLLAKLKSCIIYVNWCEEGEEAGDGDEDDDDENDDDDDDDNDDDNKDGQVGKKGEKNRSDEQNRVDGEVEEAEKCAAIWSIASRCNVLKATLKQSFFESVCTWKQVGRLT